MPQEVFLALPFGEDIPRGSVRFHEGSRLKGPGKTAPGRKESAMSDALFGLALVCVGWGVVSAVNIASYVSKRGEKINILLFRVMIYKYIHQYREFTRKETGSVGPWFYHYIVSMNAALVLVVAGIILDR